MLIQCPECDLQVSDKANTCPHCGYPLKPDAKPKSSRKPNKRRRLPNGFGQISEIKGRNLRNPFPCNGYGWKGQEWQTNM